MQLKIRLPPLSEAQSAVLAGAKRFNVVSGGQDCGLTTLAVEIAVTSSLRGAAVAIFTPDQDSAGALLRALIGILEPVTISVTKRNGIAMLGGGSVQVVSLETGAKEYFGRASLVIVDDAHRIDGFTVIWNEILKPSLGDDGIAWILGKASGSKHPFGRLYLEADETWQATTLPTSANPKADKAAIEKAREELSPGAFAQQYLGEILDGVELSLSQTVIGPDETFLDWCDRLAADGLKVDGMPFRLDDRPTMRWIYGLIPSTIEEAFGKRLVLMKCAQVGFTIMEMLAMVYMALKFAPAKVGMYLPDMKLAGMKSSERFLPIIRTIPAAYDLMLEGVAGSGRGGEGNVMVRNIGGSRFHFLWTSGKAMTESVPLDVVSFDEVQEMSTGDMEKTSERLSASRVRYTLLGSTANWPDSDIHREYKRGRQWQFWTRCPSCGEHQILDDHFPECIKLVGDDYRYVCHACGGVIEDSQIGEWRAAVPDAPFDSVHYPQFLSPTISPREIIEAWTSSSDIKNFYNRKRGKPYLDPTQVPVNLEMLNDCARIGMEMGVEWRQRASGTYMGIDQMGQFNVVIIAERLASGHMAIIHVEEIYADDPFERCDVLMARYGVQCCVLEGLPNHNQAWMFSKRHEGKVFVAHYAQLQDEMMRWGDSVPTSQGRKTDDEFRVRYNVTLDQYKVMQMAMGRIQRRATVFPDPMGLVQEITESGVKKVVPVLRDRVFDHFLHTALIADKDEDERKYRRRVVKIGKDPHFSYSYMLLNVAWARAHGTSLFILADADDEKADILKNMPGLPSAVADMMEEIQGTCGACVSFADGVCTERDLRVSRADAACPLYIPK